MVRYVLLSRDHDPAATGRVTRPEADDLLRQGIELLAEHQDRIAAQSTPGLLVVLQRLDASGKDSTIKHVMSGVTAAIVVQALSAINPQYPPTDPAAAREMTQARTELAAELGGNPR